MVYTASYSSPYSRTMSMDYTKPLLVPAGTDALGQIGKKFIQYMYTAKSETFRFNLIHLSNRSLKASCHDIYNLVN